jgi:SAM-dependent methyltransferase
MGTLNFLLPWRWKRAVGARLDAKLQSVSDGLTTRLNDTTASLLAALNAVRDQLEHQIAQQFSKLSEISQNPPPWLDTSSASLLAALNDVRDQLETRISEQFDEICELREETYYLRQAVVSSNDDISPHRQRSEAGDVQRALGALNREIAAQLGFGMHDVAKQLSDQRRRLERLDEAVASLATRLDQARGQVADHLNWLEKISFETTNLITHLDTTLQSRLNTLENVELAEIKNLTVRFDLAEQIHEIAAAQMRIAVLLADRSGWRAHPSERYRSARPEPFDSYIERARRDFPKVFGMWRERLDATLAALEQTKIGNVAVASDLYSRIFRDFVEAHAHGRVLDVGCGVFGRPYYLTGYPAELISGLEPLPMREAADFELVRGLAEYLPWPADSFSTVISATSLDHCLSLERSLSEVVRVLRPDGHLLLWIGSVPGSPKFEPDRLDFTPADQYHLFHFDKTWFEPLLEQEFELLDRLELKRRDYSHIIYDLRLKDQRQSDPAVLRRQTAAGSV